METCRLYFICLFFTITSCKAQEVKKNNGLLINEQNYYFSIVHMDSISSMNLKRLDGLEFEFKVKPSLEDLLDIYLFSEKNELIVMQLKLNDKNEYKIENIYFNNVNKRKTGFNKYTSQIINFDLSKYKFEILSCKNCSNELNFIIYKNDNIQN